MALLTPPQMNITRQPPRATSGIKTNVVTSGGVVRSSGDYGKLILIGEPGSGWRAAFDIVPGGRIMVGRPNHASRNMSTVAYLPSRAVSRMHALISMEEDGVYLTHTKATNLTWRAIDSVWTPMRPGDRTMLQHTDTLCFGMAPKTRNHVNKVDTPFLISIAIAPKGEPISQYQFVRKTIHRPSSVAPKSRELDPTMQLLMNGLDGLNVSLDNAFPEVKKEDEEITQPIGKRKRGSADEEEPDPSMNPTPNGTMKNESPSSTTRSARPTRSSSLTNNPMRPLPTARAVFGLAGSPAKKEPSDADADELTVKLENLDGLEDALPKKRRVVEADKSERVYCGDASDLPDEMTNMTLS